MLYLAWQHNCKMQLPACTWLKQSCQHEPGSEKQLQDAASMQLLPCTLSSWAAAKCSCQRAPGSDEVAFPGVVVVGQSMHLCCRNTHSHVSMAPVTKRGKTLCCTEPILLMRKTTSLAVKRGKAQAKRKASHLSKNCSAAAHSC